MLKTNNKNLQHFQVRVKNVKVIIINIFVTVKNSLKIPYNHYEAVKYVTEVIKIIVIL